MPMHDWARVKAGTYHNFHVLWMSTLTNRLIRETRIASDPSNRSWIRPSI